MGGRLGRYVGARLHRRLFLWFGLSILSTGLVVWAVMNVMNRSNGVSWDREQQRIATFVENRFAEVWEIPAQRDALAAAVARDLDLDVTVNASDGELLSRFGAECLNPRVKLPIRRGNQILGNVSFCATRHLPFSHFGTLWIFCLVFGLLWAASGKIARRLARPLSDLAHVAKELGNGKLSARAPPSWRQPGEIGVLTDAFNEMADRIEKQIADQRELLAAVSHELRTPLARIRLLIELLREGAGPERLDELERESVEIDSLVGELLASARLDFAALIRKSIDGSELARRALQRAGAPESALVMEGDLQFEGDPTLLSRALANLIDNAKKYGGGLVTLRVIGRDDFVVFEVDDAGAGFATENLEHIFKAFTPPANGQAREHGSLGLGLSLVKRIAEAHGGRAYVGQRPGGGARVGIEVTRRDPPGKVTPAA
jgi:signal transduction histidine kinase